MSHLKLGVGLENLEVMYFLRGRLFKNILGELHLLRGIWYPLAHEL